VQWTSVHPSAPDSRAGAPRAEASAEERGSSLSTDYPPPAPDHHTLYLAHFHVPDHSSGAGPPAQCGAWFLCRRVLAFCATRAPHRHRPLPPMCHDLRLSNTPRALSSLAPPLRVQPPQMRWLLARPVHAHNPIRLLGRSELLPLEGSCSSERLQSGRLALGSHSRRAHA